MANCAEALRIFTDDWNFAPPATDGYLLPYWMNKAGVLAKTQLCPMTGQRYLITKNRDTGQPVIVCPHHEPGLIAAGPDWTVSEFGVW